MKRVALIALVALLGAGCAMPSAPRITMDQPAPSLPCLSFTHREGFAAWLDAYEAGREDAIALAAQALLPKNANAKLISDMRTSLQTGTIPSFVCALDDHGGRVVWVMESPEQPETECRDTFYISLDGSGKTSELMAKERTEDCTRLCIPKRHEPELLVWQCDMRETDGKKQWSQMHLSRTTGEVEIIPCQKDGLGIPSRCLE